MRLRGLLSLLLVAAFLVGACGGGGDDAAEDEPAAEEQAESPDADEEQAGEGDISLTDEDCAFALESLAGNPLASAFSGNADPEELEESVNLFEEIAEDAPEEVRADFQVLAEAYGIIVEALADVDFDPNDPESLAALSEISEKIDQAEVDQASENISAYFEENCPSA